MDVQQYLSSKGHHGRPTSGGEITYPCWWCGEPDGSRKQKLYVNASTGMYECKVCGEAGGTTLLMRYFGDEPEREAIVPVSRRHDVLEAATQLGEKWLADDDDAMLYLLGPKRHLPPEVILSRRFGYIPPGVSLVDNLPFGFDLDDLFASGIVHKEGHRRGRDFLSNQILIPYVESGQVVQLRGKDINGRYYTGPGEHVRLFNVDAVRGADDILIVEGEFDTSITEHTLQQSPDLKAVSLAVIGLAGANAIPDDLDYYLANAKRIFIGTDPDEAGRKAAAKLHDHIGPRARILNWPQTLIDRAINDGLQLKDIDWTTWIGAYGGRWQDILVMLREGMSRRLSTVAEAGVAFRTRPMTGGLKLGYAELDAWLSPGLLPGQVMIPMAKTGTGKTIWLVNVAYNLRRHRVLFITLEMTREEIYERLARRVRFDRPFATDTDVDDDLANILICDENRLSEEGLAALVLEYEETIGDKPELVVIDYLGYYARGRHGANQYERVTDAVLQLKAEAKHHRVAIMCPTQVNRGASEGKPLDLDDARDSGAIEETADFLVSLYRPDDALDVQRNAGVPSGRLRMEILKSRHGNKDRVTTLQMGLLSLAILDAAAPGAHRLVDENYEHHRGVTYPAHLKSLTTPVQMPFRADLD